MTLWCEPTWQLQWSMEKNPRSERQWQKRYAQWEKEELARLQLNLSGLIPSGYVKIAIENGHL
jgi:hypothetical protein